MKRSYVLGDLPAFYVSPPDLAEWRRQSGLPPIELIEPDRLVPRQVPPEPQIYPLTDV